MNYQYEKCAGDPGEVWEQGEGGCGGAVGDGARVMRSSVFCFGFPFACICEGRLVVSPCFSLTHTY